MNKLTHGSLEIICLLFDELYGLHWWKWDIMNNITYYIHHNKTMIKLIKKIV